MEIVVAADGSAAERHAACSCGDVKTTPYEGTYVRGDEAFEFDADGKRVPRADGFLQYAGNTYYIINNIIVKNYYVIDGKVYDFGEDGVWTQAPLNGILQVDGELYFAQDSELVKDSYVLWKQQIYRPDGDGKLLTNTTYGDYSFGADGALTGEGTFYIQIGDTTYKVKDSIVANHTHDYAQLITKPTCTEAGYTTYTCTCGDSYTSDETDKLGHDEVNHAAKAPTCTEIGWNAYVTCSRCDYTTYSEKAALGHCFVNDKCEYCGKETSKGLSFTLNDDGKSVYLIGIGSCTDTEIVIPSEYKGKPVTRIDGTAFYGCTGLTSITIPDGVTSIGASAFKGCSGLTSITIPDSVTSIGWYAFHGCKRLESITIPDSVTGIGEAAFYGCSGLTSITIPDSVTSIGSCAFYGCSGLTGITIPDSVTGIGRAAFSGCTGLTSITIPSSVTEIGFSAFFGTAYYNNASNWTDGVLYIGSVLIDCNSDKTNAVSIKEGTTCIAGYAFDDCTGLTGITIPDSVTSIGERAFWKCTGLTSITIGNGVTSIGFEAFYGCIRLTSITFTGTKAQWNAISKGYNWDFNTGSFTVHCTDGDLPKSQA